MLHHEDSEPPNVPYIVGWIPSPCKHFAIGILKWPAVQGDGKETLTNGQRTRGIIPAQNVSTFYDFVIKYPNISGPYRILLLNVLTYQDIKVVCHYLTPHIRTL